MLIHFIGYSLVLLSSCLSSMQQGLHGMPVVLCRLTAISVLCLSILLGPKGSSPSRRRVGVKSAGGRDLGFAENALSKRLKEKLEGDFLNASLRIGHIIGRTL